jgi:hypothetical protein
MQLRFLRSGNSLSQRETVPQQCRNFGSMYFGISLSLLGIEVPARRIYCLDTLYVIGSLNLTWGLLGMMGLKWSSQGEET